MNKLTPEQINDLIRLYVDEKLSITKIGKMFGVTDSTIYRHLNRLGGKVRPVETKITPEQINDLKRLYVDEKLSASQIAETMGVTRGTILLYLKRLEVETRPPGVERKLTPEQIKDIKRLYLDEELSMTQIAKMLGVHVATIWQHLKRQDVETRR